MAEDIRAQKQALRRTLKQTAAAQNEQALREGNAAMLAALLRLPAYQAAGTVFTYVSVGSEPDTRAFIERALSAGKRVCVPRCLGAGMMQARAITGPGQLAPAPFGLLEPDESAPLVPPEEIDLAVVPCVACDAACRRLGHGGGYYDRYLAALRCPTVALCREALLQSSLPAEPFDHPVDMVLTECRLHRRKGGSQG